MTRRGVIIWVVALVGLSIVELGLLWLALTVMYQQ